MASEKNLNAVFTDIANAIRGKKGTTDQIKPINMAEEITNLPSGGGETIELSVTQNGTYVPDEGTTYSKVSVSVPQTAESGTLKALLDATKNCGSLFSNYSGTSVEGLISYSDTSSVTSMDSMFHGCRSLITIPQLDTSKVTSMGSMFYYCPSLTAIPKLDTSSVTNMGNMFNSCYKLTTIPQFDTSKVIYMNGMLQGCRSLTTVPQFDTSKVTNIAQMFYGCSKLTTIPQFDMSSVTNMNYMFYDCKSIKSILMYGMKVSFEISSSTQFEESDLVTILNNLATVTSTQTLTMGSTNLAKLTDEEKAIATNKGWTLA